MIKLILEEHKDGSLFSVVSSVQKTAKGDFTVSSFNEVPFSEVSLSSVEGLLVNAFNINNDQDSVEYVRSFFDSFGSECAKLHNGGEYTTEEIDNAVKHLLLADVILNLPSALDSSVRIMTTFTAVETSDARWFSSIPLDARRSLGLMVSAPEEEELYNLLKILMDSSNKATLSNIRRMAKVSAIRLRQELNFVKVYNANVGMENYKEPYLRFKELEEPEFGFKEFEAWMKKRFH